MRVIAGSAKGHRLELPQNRATRPLLEMARGALFNKLGPAIVGKTVLDLYAGSGAIGIEALSRGATAGTFVEMDPRALQVLERNLEHCRLFDRAILLAKPVANALSGMSGTFDLIFLDPPFVDAQDWEKHPEAQEIMTRSAAALAPGGTLIFRLEKKVTQLPERWGTLALQDQRTYGRSRICFYGADQAAE